MLSPNGLQPRATLYLEAGVRNISTQVDDPAFITFTPIAYYNTPGHANASTVKVHGGDQTIWDAPNATESPDASLPFDGAGITASVIRLTVTVPPISVGVRKRSARRATGAIDWSR